VCLCDDGFDDCDGLDANGCENTLDSLTDCGSCDTSCSLPHATASCSGRTCHISSCAQNFYDVDQGAANGCECGDAGDVADGCGSALDLGTLDSSTPITAQGVIVRRNGVREDQDCFLIHYVDANPANHRLTITFTSNPGSLVFDGWRKNCSTQECTGGTQYQSECSSTGGTCKSGNSNIFKVCVRAPLNFTCQPYTLRAARAATH
jgi:hypothetical protein